MLKYGLVMSLFLVPLFTKAQVNLVPNWSFEEQDSCQTAIQPWGSNIYYTPYWFSPFAIGGGGGVEFFSECSDDPWFNPPHTAGGYQQSYDGNNYGGFYLMYGFGREYIEVGLSPTLQSNKRYCLRFRFAYGDTSTAICDGLAAHFSTDSLQQLANTFTLIPVQPQVSMPDSVLIIDTTNWLVFEKSFVAQGGEKYMTVGNFTPFDSIYWQWIRPDALNTPRCYLFLDAVEVFECDSTNSVASTKPFETSLIPTINCASQPFRFTANQNCAIEIFDVNGKSVKHLNIQASQHDFTLDDEPSGVYFYRAVSREKAVVGKFVLSDCR